MERAFSPCLMIQSAFLGRCPRLAWSAPSALVHALQRISISEASGRHSQSAFLPRRDPGKEQDPTPLSQTAGAPGTGGLPPFSTCRRPRAERNSMRTMDIPGEKPPHCGSTRMAKAAPGRRTPKAPSAPCSDLVAGSKPRGDWASRPRSIVRSAVFITYPE